ncbi:MAG: silent information regulator protein Sir2 [Planctomycetes bacterium]|nr:silent information regulator protein Sir2 [Planctomycetota bacterium]
MERHARFAAVIGVLFACAGTSAQERLDRGLVALKTADGKVYVGWRLWADDPKDIAFNVYRKAGDGQAAESLTTEPISHCTNCVDQSPVPDAKYFIRTVRAGKEGEASPVVGVTDASAKATCVRVKLQGDYGFQKCALADLDGDGRLDYVIKQPDFNTDPYQHPGYWKKSEDTYKIEAYNHDGRFMWRYDMGWSIEAGVWYSPYIVYDLDGDGKAEVYAKAGEGDPRDEKGLVTSGAEWLVKIDGLTGKATRKLPWPDRSGYASYNYWSRNMLAVAYLDGKRPSLIVQRGTYDVIKVEAYDPDLKLIWRWDSRSEKQRYNASGSHGTRAADVDGDGRDELVLGSSVLDDNGRGLWVNPMSHPRSSHPDVCSVGDIDPDHPGLEIFYGYEVDQPKHGVCLVDAATGQNLWGFDGPTYHVHGFGMVADIIAGHPGQECYAGEKDHGQYFLYTAKGERIGSEKIDSLSPRAIWWDGDAQKELNLAGKIQQYRGQVYESIAGSAVAIADCIGDWREEILTSVPGELRIYTTTIPTDTRRACLMQDRQYRLGVAAVSMGYFYWPQLSLAGTARFPEGRRAQ